tara:strand:- start:39947 stop:40519 length:573 start_codon:yes stop_codon:yes gene_type:complete
MKNLLSALNEFYPLSKESLEQLNSIFVEKKYKKKDKLASFGEVPTNFFVLKSGIVRSYITDEKGKEFIRALYVPLRAVGAFSSLITKKSTETVYDCLTDCTLLVGDFKKYKQFAKTNIELANLYNVILERLFIRMEKRIFELSLLDAKQRYLKLLRYMPEIETLIPQYHIASYLNVTPVQLSRIRKELYK